MSLQRSYQTRLELLHLKLSQDRRLDAWSQKDMYEVSGALYE